MEYQLASSSTEEGEIVQKSFPYYKSYTQYYYYPNETTFIGKISVPQFINYKSDLFCTRLRKDLKVDYPYLFFGLLENSKTFFDNKFKFVLEIENSKNSNFELKNIKTNHVEIKDFDKKCTLEGKYEKFYQQILFIKDLKTVYLEAMRSPAVDKIIVIEDRMLEYLSMPNAFLFFRVIEDKLPLSENEDSKTERKIIKKYIFEDVFFTKIEFYKYLELFAENLVKGYSSEEIRLYESKNILVAVYSSTTFLKDGSIKRMFNGIDIEKNTRIILTKEGPVLFNQKGRLNSNADILNSLEVPEGDYLLNQNKIYKVSDSGETFEFKDIDFNDFISSRWSLR